MPERVNGPSHSFDRASNGDYYIGQRAITDDFIPPSSGSVELPFDQTGMDSRFAGFLDTSQLTSRDQELHRSKSASYVQPRDSSSSFAIPLHATQGDPFAIPFDGSTKSSDSTFADFMQDNINGDYVHRRSVSVGPPLFNSNDISGVQFEPQDRRSTSPGTSQHVSDSPLHARALSRGSQFHVDEFAVSSIPSFQQIPTQESALHMIHHQHAQTSLQQNQQAIHGGQVSPRYRQASPIEATQQGTMYIQAPQQPNIHVNTGRQQQQQQQIFLGGHATSAAQSNGSQAQAIQLQGLQVQVLPNGQTVYVSTTPPLQQTYGNNAVLFQSPQNQQQHQNIRQHAAGGQREEYVSLIPIQRGNQQLAYWQQSESAQLHSLYPTNGLISPGSTPIIVGVDNGHDSSDSGQHYHAGGRSRDPKNGRGRRGSVRGRGDPKSLTSSSMLLEEFRTSKSRDWTIRRIEGHVVEFCQDQNGSRFIQQRLEMGDFTEQQIVMREVLPAIRRLRNDVFGNYVVQKLLDFGSPKTKSDIRDTLEGEILPLSLQMYGCRVVQKALESLDEDDLPRILREFHNNVLSCIQDQNGNHVIQKCIEVLNSRARKAASLGDMHRAKFLSEQVDFVIDDVLANTTLLSCHPYGCRVLQRILEHCVEQKKITLLDEIKKCHKTLLDDQYGNYVIQHVLQYGREEDRDSIVQIVVENGLLVLSRQKFASNVVEKLLKFGNGDQRRAIVREMLKVRRFATAVAMYVVTVQPSRFVYLSCCSMPTTLRCAPNQPTDAQ
jgi:pumilio RNA-binding family